MAVYPESAIAFATWSPYATGRRRAMVVVGCASWGDQLDAHLCVLTAIPRNGIFYNAKLRRGNGGSQLGALGS